MLPVARPDHQRIEAAGTDAGVIGENHVDAIHEAAVVDTAVIIQIAERREFRHLPVLAVVRIGHGIEIARQVDAPDIAAHVAHVRPVVDVVVVAVHHRDLGRDAVVEAGVGFIHDVRHGHPRCRWSRCPWPSRAGDHSRRRQCRSHCPWARCHSGPCCVAGFIAVVALCAACAEGSQRPSVRRSNHRRRPVPVSAGRHTSTVAAVGVEKVSASSSNPARLRRYAPHQLGVIGVGYVEPRNSRHRRGAGPKNTQAVSPSGTVDGGAVSAGIDHHHRFAVHTIGCNGRTNRHHAVAMRLVDAEHLAGA